MLSKARIREIIVRAVTIAGVALPAAALLSLGLSGVSSYLARLTAVAWLFDAALVFSIPWIVVATVVAALFWRDLPQRFWIMYCTNGLLAYNAFPLYTMHFGVHF